MTVIEPSAKKGSDRVRGRGDEEEGWGAVFLYAHLHPVLREWGLMAGGGGFQVYEWVSFSCQKSISMGYLFHPKSI